MGLLAMGLVFKMLPADRFKQDFQTLKISFVKETSTTIYINIFFLIEHFEASAALVVLITFVVDRISRLCEK